MSQIYFGIESKAKTPSKIYYGVGDKSKVVQSVYLGINNRAKLIYSQSEKKVAILNNEYYNIKNITVKSTSGAGSYEIQDPTSKYKIYSTGSGTGTIKDIHTLANKIRIIPSSSGHSGSFLNVYKSSGNINFNYLDLNYIDNFQRLLQNRNFEGKINTINFNNKITYSFCFYNSNYLTLTSEKLKIKTSSIYMDRFFLRFNAPNLDVNINCINSDFTNIMYIGQTSKLNSINLTGNFTSGGFSCFNSCEINYIKINGTFDKCYKLMDDVSVLSSKIYLALNLNTPTNFSNCFNNTFNAEGYAYLNFGDSGYNVENFMSNRQLGNPFYIWVKDSQKAERIRGNIKHSTSTITFTSTQSAMPDNPSKIYSGHYNSVYNIWVLYGS